MRKLTALVSYIFISCLQLIFYQQNVFAQEPLNIKSPPVNQIMVRFRTGLSYDDRLKFHKTIGVEFLKRIEQLNVDLVKFKNEDIFQKISQLLHDPRVQDAEPNYIATALEVPNDPYVLDTTQWGLYDIKAAGSGISGWNYSKSNPGIKIAILDTGIDKDHDDLKGKIADSHNCTDSPDTNDFFGHGTHVAGIAAAVTNNGIGIAGVGYNASLINAKSLSDSGYGYYSWIADCIVWSADHGAKVINMSLGGPYPSGILEDAINYAWNKGVLIVAAAGNSGNSSPSYPAYYRNVISVAAIDRNDNKPYWSSYGRWVDVAAPGVGILSTLPNHPNVIGLQGYGLLSGTSMATPHVSGLAALLFSTSYGYSNGSVRDRISRTADKIGGTGKYWKYGRINVLAAVQPIVAVITPTNAPIRSNFQLPFFIKPIQPLHF